MPDELRGLSRLHLFMLLSMVVALPACRGSRKPAPDSTPELAALERRTALLRDDARDSELAASLANKNLAEVVVERIHQVGRTANDKDQPYRFVVRGDGAVQRFDDPFSSNVSAEARLPKERTKRLLVKLLKADLFKLPAASAKATDTGMDSVSLSLDGKKHEADSEDVVNLVDSALVASGIGGSCSDTQGCRGSGTCTARDSNCVAASDADCSQSTDCTYSGQCSARDGICVAVSDSQCAKAHDCESSGRCAAERGVCLSLYDSDCRKSEHCKKWGHCVAMNGDCVPTDETCRVAEICQKLGQCTGRNGRCVVGGDADCRQNTPCVVQGECVARGNDCVAGSDEDCRKSVACKDYGRCTLAGDRCAAK